MAESVDCSCACPAVETVLVPGTGGDPGTNGTDGLNVFTITSADFVVPAISSPVTVTVNDSTWMVVGQNVFVQGAGYFSVASKPSSTSASLTYLDYSGNTAAGNTITAGAGVSPAGTQPAINDPLLIANGGTSSATKGAAQLALGLGQTPTSYDGSALAYAITNSYAEIAAAATVTAPAAGKYLILARCTVVYTGATFASSRTLSVRVRNTTSSTTHETATSVTGTQTTATFPEFTVALPPLAVTLAASDVLQLQCQLDVVPSAGTAVISSATLTIVPLALA